MLLTTILKSMQKICHIFHNNGLGGQQDSFSVMESDSQCRESPPRFIPHNGFYGMFLASVFLSFGHLNREEGHHSFYDLQPFILISGLWKHFEKEVVVAELVICKSCGFIMDKSKLRDKCPACGVAAKMFEPYIEKISPKRKRILSLDLHPVLVHFPQAFIVSIFALSLIALAVHGSARATVIAAITVLGTALPLVIIGAFLTGLLDGKIRFRRVTTPILKQKMIWGVLFFLCSCGIFAVVQSKSLASPAPIIVVALLSLPALGCATLLGLLGSSILNSKFPG